MDKIESLNNDEHHYHHHHHHHHYQEQQQQQDEDENNDNYLEESLDLVSKDLTMLNKKLLKNKFSNRVRSLSNDFLRTIEYAHGCTDLHNSTFAAATKAQAQNQVSLVDTPHLNQHEQLEQQKDCTHHYKRDNYEEIANETDTSDSSKQNKEELGIVISIWEIFVYIWGCFAFFLDIISDIVLANTYFKSGKKWLCTLTLVFVIIPNVTLTLFSLSWYIDTYKAKRAKWKQESKDDPSKSIIFWLVTICLLAFQLELIIEYVKGFVYTVKAWVYRTFYKNKVGEKYYLERQIKCDVDIGMLRIIEVFMDSGPQVLLQLYVILTQKFTNEQGVQIEFSWSDLLNHENQIVLKQLISISSSLFSMSYAIAGYHRCLRNQQYIFSLNTSCKNPLPKPISWWATIMEFLWYLFLISPRVLSMALFASTHRSWFFIIIFIHWSAMYFWILGLKTNYCLRSDEYSAREEIFEKFYNFVCAFIYIFVYFNVKHGSTRYRYLIYYCIFYVENVLFCVIYFLFNTSEESLVLKVVFMFICLVGFWLAILFQSLYYIYLHPSHDFLICYRPLLVSAEEHDDSLLTKQKEMQKNFYFIYKVAKKPVKRKAQKKYKSNECLKSQENCNDFLRVLFENHNEMTITPKNTSTSILPTTSSSLSSITSLKYTTTSSSSSSNSMYNHQQKSINECNKFKNPALFNYKLNEFNVSLASSFTCLFKQQQYQQKDTQQTFL